MKNLIKRRDKAAEQLRKLATTMLIGSLSETYRTCGNPNCRCHSTGPKHGPHLYVSYRGDTGRTTGYYVRTALHDRVRSGLEAWREFQELAKEVAALNKQIMDEENPPHRRRKRSTPQ